MVRRRCLLALGLATSLHRSSAVGFGSHRLLCSGRRLQQLCSLLLLLIFFRELTLLQWSFFVSLKNRRSDCCSSCFACVSHVCRCAGAEWVSEWGLLKLIQLKAVRLTGALRCLMLVCAATCACSIPLSAVLAIVLRFSTDHVSGWEVGSQTWGFACGALNMHAVDSISSMMWYLHMFAQIYSIWELNTQFICEGPVLIDEVRWNPYSSLCSIRLGEWGFCDVIQFSLCLSQFWTLVLTHSPVKLPMRTVLWVCFQQVVLSNIQPVCCILSRTYFIKYLYFLRFG